MEKAINEIVAEFNGRLDVFVANSGIAWTEGAFIDGSAETARKVMAVNVDGVMWCAKTAGAHFRRQKKEGTTTDGKPLENFVAGSFIATASMSGSIVNVPQLQAVYNGSKAAVIHFCTSRVLFPPRDLQLIVCRQEFGCRVDRVRPRQHGLPGIYQDGHLSLCVARDQGPVEEQDGHGVSLP